jgi:hypothetical protein
MSKIKLLTDFKCKICDNTFSNQRTFSSHLKTHDITVIDYTIKYLLDNVIPKCACGCDHLSKIYPYSYRKYHVGHNPNSTFWQIRYSKDSEEYKIRVELLKNKLTKYYETHEKIVSDETRKLLSDNRKEFIKNNPEIFQEWIDKMKETKRVQSREGKLSGENNYFNKLTDEEKEKVNEKRKQTNESKSDAEKLELSNILSKIQYDRWNNLTLEEQNDLIIRRKIGQDNVPLEKKLEKGKRHSEWIIQNYHNDNKLTLRPLYNKETIPYIVDILNVRYNTEFRHAECNNGEFRIYDKELKRFYFADAYSEELNMWIEFDEPDKFKNGELLETHIERETRIRNCIPDVIINRIYFDKKLH